MESVVEKALDELHFEDFDVADLEKELNGSTALGSDVFPASYQSLTVNPVGSTAPLTIPGAISEPSPQQSFTPQSPSSPRDQYSPFSAKVVRRPKHHYTKAQMVHRTAVVERRDRMIYACMRLVT